MIFDFLTKAKDLFYSNATSGLSADNVQSAIDEVKGGVNTNVANIANMLSALKSAGINENILSANMIPNNLSFADLKAKNTVTFFTVLKDSNFPNNYGSGVLVPQADTTVKYIIYMAYDVIYTGRVVSGIVTWDEKTNKSTVTELANLMQHFTLSSGWTTNARTYVTDLNDIDFNSVLMAFGKSTETANYVVNCPTTDSYSWYYVVTYRFCQTSDYRKQIAYHLFSNKRYERTCQNGTWTKWVDPINGTTVWENASISTFTGTYSDVTINIDFSNYTEFEIIYAHKPDTVLFDMQTTGRIPISDMRITLGAVLSPLGYASRQCTVKSGSSGSMVFTSANYTDITNTSNNIETGSYCIPIKIIAY